MNVSRRHALLALAAFALLATPAAAAETIRVGLPTKTYWPTTVAETAVRQKLFEKEGITAELTIYRSGAETFEGMAAGAADIILDPPSLVSAGRKKGVMSRIVANAAMGNFGWQLMVPAKSTLDVKDLNGKKVGDHRGRIGLRPAGAVDHPGPARSTSPACRSAAAAWCPTCSPAMSKPPWSIRRSASRSRNRARRAPSSTIPRKCRRTSPRAGSCSTNSPQEKPQLVQKAINALYGAVQFMRANRDATVKLIADLYEMPAEIAALEYENTIMKLETDGNMAPPT